MNPLSNIKREIGGYRELDFHLPLPRHIDAVWVHTTPVAFAGSAPSHHRLLPDSCVNICFYRYRNGALSCGQLVFMGPILRPSPMTLVGGLEMASVRLHPEWALPLLGIHPRDHVDETCALSDIAPDLDGRLLDRLERSSGAIEAAHILLQWATQLTPGNHTFVSDRALAATHMIRRADGYARVSKLSDRLDISDRHLRRLVEGATGYSPKQYARLVRFNKALLLADAEPSPSWAALATEAGYFDQAHMIRDFTALAECSPAALNAERRAESELYNRS